MKEKLTQLAFGLALGAGAICIAVFLWNLGRYGKADPVILTAGCFIIFGGILARQVTRQDR